MMDVAINNLRYADPAGTLIDMDVSIDGAEPIPFTLSPTDTAPVAEAVRALLAGGSYEIAPYAAPLVDLAAYAMARRDALIDGGVTFAGTVFQSRPTDRENIQGAFSLALAAILGGVQPGDLRWNPEQPDADFGFIALDNSIVPMDAQTVVAFGRAAASRKGALIFAAWAIKDRIAAGTITTTAEIDAAFAAL